MDRTAARIVMSAIVFATAATAKAQAPDPMMGTWVLNVAKSKYQSGPPLQSQTRTYTSAPNGYRFVADAVNAEGVKAHSDVTLIFDNRYHGIEGNTIGDSLMINRVDAYTVETTLKKGMTLVTFSTRTISKDGKTLVNTSRGISDAGLPYTNVEVFEKQ